MLTGMFQSREFPGSTPHDATRRAVERSGREAVDVLEQTTALLSALVGRAEAAERRELEREKQDRWKFRVEIAAAVFSFIAAATGIIALLVASA
jgi:hypothetical protein